MLARDVAGQRSTPVCRKRTEISTGKSLTPICGGGNSISTYVLVHGAWHGGWCWKKVAPLLRAAGREVFTPTLTGLGERAHLANPAIDLAMHIADVVNLLEAEELDKVVLV